MISRILFFQCMELLLKSWWAQFHSIPTFLVWNSYGYSGIQIDLTQDPSDFLGRSYHPSSGYYNWNGISQWKSVSMTKKVFVLLDAVDYCRTRGMDLASVHSEAEWQTIMKVGASAFCKSYVLLFNVQYSICQISKLWWTRNILQMVLARWLETIQ